MFQVTFYSMWLFTVCDFLPLWLFTAVTFYRPPSYLASVQNEAIHAVTQPAELQEEDEDEDVVVIVVVGAVGGHKLQVAPSNFLYQSI
jgi:hypothetical protein